MTPYFFTPMVLRFVGEGRILTHGVGFALRILAAVLAVPGIRARFAFWGGASIGRRRCFGRTPFPGILPCGDLYGHRHDLASRQ